MRYVLRFRAEHRNDFNAIKRGTKKVETRAATTKYRGVRVGDTLCFVCGSSRFVKRVLAVRRFRSIRALARTYPPRIVNPRCRTVVELVATYREFPGYREKLKRYGIIAFKLL